jgi:hypothetical protein
MFYLLQEYMQKSKWCVWAQINRLVETEADKILKKYIICI